MKRILLSLFLALGFVSNAHADVLAFYDFSNTTRNGPSAASVTTDPGVTASVFTRGAGLTLDNTQTQTDFFLATGFGPGTTEASAVTANDFFTFNVNPNSGNSLNLSSLDIKVGKSAAGPQTVFVRSSVDNFTSTIFTVNLGANAVNPTTNTPGDLSGATYQNLTAPIEFRIYGYGATSTGGNGRIDDVRLNGTVMATPEPETWAMMALGLGALAMFSWKRKRSAEEASFGGGLAI